MALAASSWRTALDRFLRREGQDIVITRTLSGGSTISVTCRAQVRTTLPQEDPHGLSPSQISGPLTQPDMRVVISGTELDANNWPLTDGWPLPLRTDQVTIAGKSRTIQVIAPTFVSNALARIDMTVRG